MRRGFFIFSSGRPDLLPRGRPSTRTAQAWRVQVVVVQDAWHWGIAGLAIAITNPLRVDGDKAW